MKTIKEAKATLDNLHDEHAVGQFIFNASPGGRYVVWAERTYKMRELDEWTVTAVSDLMNKFGAISVTIKSGANGPDRVTVVKAL